MTVNAPPPKSTAVLGLLVVILGVFVICAVSGAFGPAKPQPAPAWVGVCAGLVFIAGGLVPLLHTLAGEDPRHGSLALRAAMLVLMLAITGGLATVALWAALGAGPHEFRASGFIFTGRIGETAGRVVFGIGGVIALLIFAAFLIGGVRGLLKAADG